MKASKKTPTVHYSKHPSKFIKIDSDDSEKKVEIDTDLIPLITELNKIGLRTMSCCQGSDTDYAFIMFDIKKSNIAVEMQAFPDKDQTFTIRWPHKFKFES